MLDGDNRLFAMAREAERQPSVLAAIVVACVTLAITIVAGQMFAGIMLHRIASVGTLSDPITEGIRRLIADSAGFWPVYLCLWGWLIWCGRSFRTLGFERQRFAHTLPGGFVGLGMMSAVAIAITMLPQTTLARGTL